MGFVDDEENETALACQVGEGGVELREETEETEARPVELQELGDTQLLVMLLKSHDRLLQEQIQQTKHLQGIATAARLWLFLTLLGLIAGCLLWLMGGSILGGL